MDRLQKISNCMKEIELARRDQVPGNIGALIGELDWLDELHYLLYQACDSY